VSIASCKASRSPLGMLPLSEARAWMASSAAFTRACSNAGSSSRIAPRYSSRQLFQFTEECCEVVEHTSNSDKRAVNPEASHILWTIVGPRETDGTLLRERRTVCPLPYQIRLYAYRNYKLYLIPSGLTSLKSSSWVGIPVLDGL